MSRGARLVAHLLAGFAEPEPRSTSIPSRRAASGNCWGARWLRHCTRASAATTSQGPIDLPESLTEVQLDGRA